MWYKKNWGASEESFDFLVKWNIVSSTLFPTLTVNVTPGDVQSSYEHDKHNGDKHSDKSQQLRVTEC